VDTGVGKPEAPEALLITAVQGAGTQLVWNKKVQMKFLT